MKQRRRVIHPEAMSMTVRNVYNLHPWDQNDYVKEKVNRYMSFIKVGNNVNDEALEFLLNKRMEHYECKIYYETVIVYKLT